MGLANLCRKKRSLYLGIVMLIIALLTLTVGMERFNILRSLRSRELSMGDITVNRHSTLRSNDLKPGNISNSRADENKTIKNEMTEAKQLEIKLPSGHEVSYKTKDNEPNSLSLNVQSRVAPAPQINSLPLNVQSRVAPEPQINSLSLNVQSSVALAPQIQSALQNLYKPVLHVDDKESHGNDINKSSPKIVKINQSFHNNRNFLDDYDTYPCISGLSLFSPEKWATDGICVRTVNVSQIVNKNTTPTNCVSVRTYTGFKMPMCIYPAAIDKWVSGNIVKGNLWEGDLVAKMTNFIKSQAGVEFLDLGSNIGSYSLALAHEGINVTAIDPLHSNMELLSKSIILGKLHDKITLIWNAVANHHNIVSFKEDLNNVGGTQITDIKSTYNTDNMDVARAITFDDLLPLFKGKHVAIKMDIETSEYIALLGGQRFFDEVDVRVIQMEFSFHSKGKDGQHIIDYLSLKGFRPYRDLQKRLPLDGTHMSKWPNDIYFLKPDKFKWNI